MVLEKKAPYLQFFCNFETVSQKISMHQNLLGKLNAVRDVKNLHIFAQERKNSDNPSETRHG